MDLAVKVEHLDVKICCMYSIYKTLVRFVLLLWNSCCYVDISAHGHTASGWQFRLHMQTHDQCVSSLLKAEIENSDVSQSCTHTQ